MSTSNTSRFGRFARMVASITDAGAGIDLATANLFVEESTNLTIDAGFTAQ